ncbi:MAG: DsbA family oxidoreductase [Burkholderiaceae bacterium]
MTDNIRITVWSDYVCPFYYLEEPVYECLRQNYREAVDVQWCAFELRPEPVPTLDPDGEYLHTVWNQTVYPMARARKMTLRLPPVQPRSRKALELAEFARDHGRFGDTHRALFKAFFEDGLNLADIDVLVEIGTAAGLDRAAVRKALEQDAYLARVIRDEREARGLSVTAVPTALVSAVDQPLAEAEIISGAQPYEALNAAVARAIERQAR